MARKGLFLLGTLALATSAGGSAADEVYPGLNCHTRSGAQAVDVMSGGPEITVRVSGTGSFVEVMCPIVRQNVESTAPVSVYARIRNRNSNTGSSCQIWAFDWRGENLRVGNRPLVTGANNFQGVTMTSPLPSPHPGGTLQLYCSISRNSQLVNYYVTPQP